MGSSARKIEIEIVGDTRGFSKALGRAANDADSFGSKLGSGLVMAGKVAGAALIAAGGAAAFAGTKMIGMASDAAEVQSKLEVVFGNTLPGITKEIDKFSAATGASRFEMREQAGDLGALLVPMLGSKQAAADMSVGFVKLATDLGSFNNIPVAEALEKIRAGLVGESEPLRSLGVLLTEASTKEYAYANGIAKRGAELTEVQKVEARAGQIMQQTALAQGDATRTADSFSNQLKKLKNSVSDTATELGMQLLPMASKVLSAMNEGAEGVQNFLQKLNAAKGFEAKVRVVFEGLKELATEAIKIGVDVGKNIGDALAKVNWTAAGSSIAKSIGAALKTAIPAAMNLAAEFTSGLLRAVEAVDWAIVGREMGIGIKDGVKKGAISWVKNGMIDLLRAGATPSGVVANAIGNDLGGKLARSMGDSTDKGLVRLPSVVENRLRQIGSLTNTASAQGSAIGSSLTSGIISGIGANAAGVINAAAAVINQAVASARAAAGAKSPSRVFAELGSDVIAGFILGITTNMPKVSEKMAEAVGNALEAAREKVSRAQDVLGAAFGKLGEYVSRQFAAKTEAELDKLAAKWDRRIAAIVKKGDKLTASEQALEDISTSEAQRSRDRASQEAAAQLKSAEAMDEGLEKEKAVAAAREAIRVADLAHTIATLEGKAAKERETRDKETALSIKNAEETKARELKNLEERRSQQNTKLDEQLADLATRLEKHPEEYDKIQRKVMKLLASYGIPMTKAGLNLGKAFAAGLNDAADEVEKAAKNLATIVQKYLKTKSPTEKGPMSTLDRWWTGFGSTLVSGLDYGPVQAAAARLAGTMASGPPAFAGAGGGSVARAAYGYPSTSAPVVNNFNFPNYVGNRRELVEAVRTEVSRATSRNR